MRFCRNCRFAVAQCSFSKIYCILFSMDSKKAKKKAWLFTQSQALFITIKLFALNKLPSYAEACSFGLLFSFLPIFMITLIVMTRILHATPELIEPLLNSILSAVPQMGRFFAPDRFMRMLSSAKIGGLFEIFIFAFAFWMSRRFLVSIFQSFKMIFHTRHERKSVYSQLMMFAVVTIIIFAFTAVVFAYILLRYVTGLSVFVSLVQRFPQLDIFNHFISEFFIKYFPNILILIVVTVLYKTVPGTKPHFRSCFFTALFCTVSFWAFRIILHFFLNAKNYNVLYGMMGQVIVLLMDIFFFFTFFLFCAQYLFVRQFFDELLVGELYLLPKREESSFAGRMRRRLFLRPEFLLADQSLSVDLNPGDIVFSHGEMNDEAYYIVEGSVESSKSDGVIKYTEGDFFGEISCTLRKPHDSTAWATSRAKIIKIKGEVFRFLVEQDNDVARKTLSQYSSYFADYYGKTEMNLADYF